jgi:Lipocalin-like domain
VASNAQAKLNVEKSIEKISHGYARWHLVQVSRDTVSADGTRRPLYGANAKGMIIYTSDGYFTLMQASVDLPKLKSGLPSKATPEEAKAVIAGSIAYFGKYSLDETSKVLSLDIHASTFAKSDR